MSDLISRQKLLDDLDTVPWYQFRNGYLEPGAEDEKRALCKFQDVLDAVNGMPVEAILMDGLLDEEQIAKLKKELMDISIVKNANSVPTELMQEKMYESKGVATDG